MQTKRPHEEKSRARGSHQIQALSPQKNPTHHNSQRLENTTKTNQGKRVPQTQMESPAIAQIGTRYITQDGNPVAHPISGSINKHPPSHPTLIFPTMYQKNPSCSCQAVAFRCK